MTTRTCIYCKEQYETHSEWRSAKYCSMSCTYKQYNVQRLLRRFGITQQQYDDMYTAQNGVCGICKRPETVSPPRRLAVDHDYKTRKIRGLLCFQCNIQMGWYDKYKQSIRDYEKDDDAR